MANGDEDAVAMLNKLARNGKTWPCEQTRQHGRLLSSFL